MLLVSAVSRPMFVLSNESSDRQTSWSLGKIENIACSSKSPFLSKFIEGDLLHKALFA